MFRVKEYDESGTFIIQDELGRNLHSDGSIYETAECFPTEKIAQAVLDKYQPKHEWKHGDVFVNRLGVNMVYLIIDHTPRAHCLGNCTITHQGENLDDLLDEAKFLFNVNDNIEEK